MFDRITDRSIKGVLVSGFGLVILMLLASGFIGVRNAKVIQESAQRLVGEQMGTARLVDEVHREQGALQAVFNNLSKDPNSVDRNEILSQLNEADVAMDLVVPDAALKDAEGLDERLLMLQRKVTRMQLRDLAAELKANG